MNPSRSKNIFLLAGALAGLCAGYYYVQRDQNIVDLWTRNAYTVDSIHATPDERRMAQRFSDSTLPGLKNSGLILSYRQREWEEVIFVSGPLWKKRSPFFKESFVTELLLYQKVRGMSGPTHIVDQQNGYIYATVIPPDQKFMRE